MTHFIAIFTFIAMVRNQTLSVSEVCLYNNHKSEKRKKSVKVLNPDPRNCVCVCVCVYVCMCVRTGGLLIKINFDSLETLA